MLFYKYSPDVSVKRFCMFVKSFSYFTGNLNVSEQIWDNFMLKFNRILIFKPALDAGGHCCCPVGGGAQTDWGAPGGGAYTQTEHGPPPFTLVLSSVGSSAFLSASCSEWSELIMPEWPWRKDWWTCTFLNELVEKQVSLCTKGSQLQQGNFCQGSWGYIYHPKERSDKDS